MHGVWETQPYNSNIYMFCKINHLFIQFYKKLFVRVIVLRFAISKVVFDIDENNSHDEDVSNIWSNKFIILYFVLFHKN